MILEEIKKFGVVPVVVLEHAEDARPLAEAFGTRRPALRRSDFPYRSGGRIYPYYDGDIPGHAGRSRNNPYGGAGRPGSKSRGKIYRKSGI